MTIEHVRYWKQAGEEEKKYLEFLMQKPCNYVYSFQKKINKKIIVVSYLYLP